MEISDFKQMYSLKGVKFYRDWRLECVGSIGFGLAMNNVKFGIIQRLAIFTMCPWVPHLIHALQTLYGFNCLIDTNIQ